MTRKALPLTLALLLGCGGGGDGTLAPGTPTVGVLTDSPVSGVSYETESKSGVTDDEGKFEYKVGETVTFRIGSVELGSGEAKPETSPFDLVPGATPITKTPRIIEALMEDETFWQVVNLAVFLQTLDDDDDPENGIEITNAVAALFDDADIDFTLAPEDFRDAFALRQIIGLADADRLFSVRHGVVNPGRAMQHLYDTLEIDPLIFAPATSTQDVDIDFSTDTVRSFSYDAQGRPTRVEAAFDVGEDPYRTELWEYDRRWNETRYSTQSGINEPSVTIQTFDALGNKTSETAADEIETWEYDQNGSMIRYEAAGGGLSARVETNTYDERGQRTRTEVNTGGDEDIDDLFVWQYDDNGNVTRYERDLDGDGPSGPRVTVSEYDDADRLVKETFDQVGNDGLTDHVTTFGYNDAGRLVLRERDDSANGSIDFRERYTYDEDGNQTSTERDEDANDSADYIFARTFNTDGRVLTVEIDSDGNGTVDSRTTWNYDDDGNTLAFIRDTNADGTPERVESWEYDENGNELVWQRIIDEGSFRDLRNERTFERTGWLLVWQEAYFGEYLNFGVFANP